MKAKLVSQRDFIKLPSLIACVHHGGPSGEYSHKCKVCKSDDFVRKEKFLEAKRDQAYRIIWPVWKKYLERTREHRRTIDKKSNVREAKRLITRAPCPWKGKLGLKIWNEVLVEISVKSEDYYIPVQGKRQVNYSAESILW